MIAVSVVSHGHGSMVERLTRQLLAFPDVASLILTLNIDEQLDLPGDPRLKLVKNDVPRGFGANHNAAFALCDSRYYCVVNPDIELSENPFPALVEALDANAGAVVAPIAYGARGQVEDSWRRFPSPLDLVLKAAGLHKGTYADAVTRPVFEPDWVAGMFMLFDARDYAASGGFDERFFLYYEDVDICVRLRASGRRVIGCSWASVVHLAQRASWREGRHFVLHLMSVWRYFTSDWRRVFPSVLRRAMPQARDGTGRPV